MRCSCENLVPFCSRVWTSSTSSTFGETDPLTKWVSGLSGPEIQFSKIGELPSGVWRVTTDLRHGPCSLTSRLPSVPESAWPLGLFRSATAIIALMRLHTSHQTSTWSTGAHRLHLSVRRHVILAGNSLWRLQWQDAAWSALVKASPITVPCRTTRPGGIEWYGLL